MSAEILYKEKNELLFWKYWQELVDRNDMSAKYLRPTIDARIINSKDKGLFHSDKSFIYLVDNKPMAGTCLIIEKKGQDLVGSLGNDYIYAPIFDKQFSSFGQTIEKKVFAIIDNIAVENKVKKIMFWIDSLNTAVIYNYLHKYNYLDSSILSYFIDLSLFEGAEDILKSCRKGHKCDIKRILNDAKFFIFIVDKNNPSYEAHEEYRKLHHKCSGRITRPKETFDLQFEKLKQGNAALFGLSYKEKLNSTAKNIAYSYFEFNAERANYASAADDPCCGQFFLYHALFFSAVKYLKEIGIKYIDAEQPASPSMQYDYYPDRKQLNIALFKRGFCGDFKPAFRGIKYFSKSAFKKDTEKFIANYKNTVIN